jgi:hypothetical protein
MGSINLHPHHHIHNKQFNLLTLYTFAYGNIHEAEYSKRYCSEFYQQLKPEQLAPRIVSSSPHLLFA